jgi:hypothetical protein
MAAIGLAREKEEEEAAKVLTRPTPVATAQTLIFPLPKPAAAPAVDKYAEIVRIANPYRRQRENELQRENEQLLINMVLLLTDKNLPLIDNVVNNQGQQEMLGHLARAFYLALESIPKKTVRLKGINPFTVDDYPQHLNALIMPDRLHDSLFDLKALLNDLVPVVNRMETSKVRAIHGRMVVLVENAMTYARRTRSED